MGVPLRPFGRTGVKVSALALGTMMFGRRGNPDHDDSVRIIHRALDAGINLVDTADVYSQGESETIVGKAIEGRRDEVFLATKFHGQVGSDIGPRTFEQLEGQLEAAQARLAPDVLDEIDKIVPPGITLSARDQGYLPPALTDPARRRRG
ncbi:MAG: aldo/keto reductase [Actinoallomurus sp.]